MFSSSADLKKEKKKALLERERKWKYCICKMHILKQLKAPGKMCINV